MSNRKILERLRRARRHRRANGCARIGAATFRTAIGDHSGRRRRRTPEIAEPPLCFDSPSQFLTPFTLITTPCPPVCVEFCSVKVAAGPRFEPTHPPFKTVL